MSQLPQEMLDRSLGVTSARENVVTGNTRVYMTSMAREDLPPRLILPTVPGVLEKGVPHA